MRQLRRSVLLTALLLTFAVATVAIEPTIIVVTWDYNLADNPGVTGWRIIKIEPGGARTDVIDVPFPAPLPPPGPDGFAVFTVDVVPDKTGRWNFVAIALTADPVIFSNDSNLASVVVKPDPPRNVR